MSPSRFHRPPGTLWGRLLVFVPAAAWYAVICAFSAQTGAESGRLSGALVDQSIGWLGEWGEIFRWNWEAVQLLSFLIRKAAHMGVYFILAALVLYGLWRLGRTPPAMAGLTLCACAVLAALDELHQRFVPGREGKPTDVLIDLGGAACFLLLWWALRALLTRRRPRRPS